jgi:(1->4)-alpha-D-glucan 1-alpha-D-glucosylmutase
LNATATHDTKRGEDMRARLNILTEIPEQWDQCLERWMGWNGEKKVAVNGVLVPSASEEFLIYQTLLGAWPTDPAEESAFIGRVQEFMVKALREAKQNSSWIAPHESYERAVQEFIARIVEPDSEFMRDFAEFRRLLTRCGVRNSLGQLLLKIASPGVPDFFQGTEFWQFSLVDPDNRRPVDYKTRMETLDALRRREAEDRIGLIRELAGNPGRDAMKMWVTHKALEFRKANRELFARGEYLALKATGTCANYVGSFARRLKDRWVVVIASRWCSRLEDWNDTELTMPLNAPGEWHDVLTGLIPASWRLADLLGEFPVAMLAAKA